MALHWSVRGAACLVLASAVLTSCGNGGPELDSTASLAPTRPSSPPSITATHRSPSPATHTRPPRPTQQEIAAAVTALRHYLQTWVTQGPARASRYLVAGQRLTSDQGAPRIGSGTLTSYRLYRWKGPSEFTLLVSMDLGFTSDPLAWSRGRNDRFVTAHRVGSHDRYRLELATSP